MTEYVHVGSHADILKSGRHVGPGDRVTDDDLDLDGEDRVLVDEGVLVDAGSFGKGASNKPDQPKATASRRGNEKQEDANAA